MKSIGEEVIQSHLSDEASMCARKLTSFLKKAKITKTNHHYATCSEFGDRMGEARLAKAWAKRPIRVFILLALITVVYHAVDKYKRFKRFINGGS